MANGDSVSRTEVYPTVQRINEFKQSLPAAEIFNGAIASLHDILEVAYQAWNTEGGIEYTDELKSYVDNLNCASNVESLNSQIKSATATATEEPHDDVLSNIPI